jgi:transitional endoplasmic reticulum ATPase
VNKIDTDKLDQLHEAIDTKGFNDAIKYMFDRVKVEEQIVDVTYTFKCFEHEGALALFQAVENVIGHCDITASKGESGDEPPQLINVLLPNGEEIQIPFGTVRLPAFDKDSYLSMDYDWETVELSITGTIRMKFQYQVNDIMKEAQRILDTSSLYTGRAINIEFDSNGNIEEPEFLDLSNIDESKILLCKEAKEGLVPILARIRDTDRCIEEGLDLKYGVLLEGPYGTGKTLIAFLIAKLAVENGWTFIYLKDCKNLATTLKICENYTKSKKGIVVFTEDIDQAVRGNRDAAIQRILNTLDGGDTKNKAIISIFTTNHIELIEPTFLRGKRIGGLISLGSLDKETALEFINTLVIDNNGKSLIEANNRDAAAEALVGIVPAFASEIIDRAKAYMINRKASLISANDIIIAANSYKKQMEHAQLKQHNLKENELAAALKLILTAGLQK